MEILLHVLPSIYTQELAKVFLLSCRRVLTSVADKVFIIRGCIHDNIVVNNVLRTRNEIIPHG